MIIYSKKLYTGIKNTGKKMYVELTIKEEHKEKKTTALETVTDYKTLSMCGTGGQNREEIADINSYKELFITVADLNTIIQIWDKWHLNDMNAGTEKQTAFIMEWEKDHKYNYTAVCKALKKVGLYEDNGYKYGHAWLVEIIPDEVITEITAIFDKYDKPEHIEQQSNKASFKNFEIKANYKGTKKAKWGDNFNNHMITVTNTETGQKITFEFWASIANPELKTEYDILNAFYCFVSDAIAGSESFDNFCSEFGYNTNSRTAKKIHRKCKKQLEKLKKIYDDDICELANELSEQYT